jgi:hypothetical protein
VRQRVLDATHVKSALAEIGQLVYQAEVPIAEVQTSLSRFDHTPSRSGARWPPGVVVLVAALLFVTLPPHLTLGPTWLMPLLIVALDIPFLVSGPIRLGQSTRVRRATAFTMFRALRG